MRSARPWIIALTVVAIALLLLLNIRPPVEQAATHESITQSSATLSDSTDSLRTDTRTAFPESNLLSALATVCADNEVVDPDEGWSDTDLTTRRYVFDEIQSKTSDRLSASTDAEHLLVAALLEEHSPTRIELLNRAIARDPADPILLWNAVRLCSELDDRAACPLEEWQRRLVEVDGQNSETWIRVATNRYSAGDRTGALEALQRASTAAESRIFWPDLVEAFERGYVAAADLEFSQRAAMAFGDAASQLPRFSPALNMCRDESEIDEIWAYSCLAYGELLENVGKTEIGVSLGQSFQILAWEALGDDLKAAEVRQRQDARRQEMLSNSRNREYNRMVERIFFSDPALFSAYLMAVRSNGEIEARRRMYSEVERLLELRPDLACEPPRPDAQ